MRLWWRERGRSEGESEGARGEAVARTTMGADKTSEFKARVKAAKVKAGGRIGKAAGPTKHHNIGN